MLNHVARQIDLLAGNDAQSQENSSNMSGLCIPCRNKVLWARNCPSNSVSPFHTFTLSPFGLFIFLLFHLVTASPFTILTVHLFTLSHFFAFHHFTFSSGHLFSFSPLHLFTFSPSHLQHTRNLHFQHMRLCRRSASANESDLPWTPFIVHKCTRWLTRLGSRGRRQRR